MTSFRRTVERRAGPVLVLLAGLPRAVPFLLVLVLVVVGLLVPGPVAVVALVLLFLLLGLQLFLAWPVLPPPQRGLRAAVLALLVLAAFSRF